MDQDVLSIVRGALPKVRSPLKELSPEQLLSESRVTPSTQLPPMEPLFRMYDVPCFYRGELVAVCGKAKSGKTLFLSIIMAAGLKGYAETTDGGKDAETNGNDVCSLRATNPLRVLWLDTEQSRQSTQDIMVKRIMPLAEIRAENTDSTEMAATAFDEAFFAYNLRGLGFEKRRQLMEVAITSVKPDLMVVDGIKDLVTDINDAVQATLIMEQLMALAQAHRCCIVCVLHQNKSEADHNMRGSIGTELTNKAFEVYSCEYIEERDAFKVSQRLSRRERIKRKLYYQLGDDGLPSECDTVSEQPRDAQGRWTSTNPVNTDLVKLFTQAMEGRSQRPFSELMAVAMKIGNMDDRPYYYECFNEAIKRGIIVKTVVSGNQYVQLAESSLPF